MQPDAGAQPAPSNPLRNPEVNPLRNRNVSSRPSEDSEPEIIDQPEPRSSLQTSPFAGTSRDVDQSHNTSKVNDQSRDSANESFQSTVASTDDEQDVYETPGATLQKELGWYIISSDELDSRPCSPKVFLFYLVFFCLFACGVLV